MVITFPEKNWKDGRYICRCVICSSEYIGHKASVICCQCTRPVEEWFCTTCANAWTGDKESKCPKCATPRTDAAEYDINQNTDYPAKMMVDADFARGLERELAKVKAELEWLTTNCKLVYWPPPVGYPIEHNPHAGKDGMGWLMAAMKGDK